LTSSCVLFYSVPREAGKRAKNRLTLEFLLMLLESTSVVPTTHSASTSFSTASVEEFLQGTL